MSFKDILNIISDTSDDNNNLNLCKNFRDGWHIRDRPQITFVMANRFNLLSDPSHPPLLQSQAKLNEKQLVTCLLVYCKYFIWYVVLYFFLLYITSALTAADIIFYNFLEPNPTFSEKNFHHKFSFFNRFTQIPHPLKGQNPLSMTKVFCWCSLTFVMLK